MYPLGIGTLVVERCSTYYIYPRVFAGGTNVFEVLRPILFGGVSIIEVSPAARKYGSSAVTSGTSITLLSALPD